MEPTHRTLVLSQGFEPLRIVPWQRAITLLFLGKVELVEEYDRDIKTTSIVIKIPAVVRLLGAFRRHKKPVKFSRISVYARDSYTCQYCCIRWPIHSLTYDHVVPRSHGGKTTWTNIATCCLECNRKKGGRTPEQAGMKLLKQPAQPSVSPVLVVSLHTQRIPESWTAWMQESA